MIKINDLTQIYKSGKGVFDLNFEVKKGEVFGYLGPNGAGKTTTIRNILGFSNATKGIVTIQDKNTRVHAAELQSIIGYLPGEIAFFDNMSGQEFLTFMCQMRKMTDFQRRDELIDMFQLDIKGKIKKMSKGMKQKLGIVAAFMHNPDILILDEPTSGLDPLMQSKFLDLIQSEKSKGKTILMSSHLFEEVERVCDRAGIIRDGKLVAIEDVSALKEMKKEHYIIHSESNQDEALLTEAGLSVKKIKDGTFEVGVTKGYKHFFHTLSNCHVTSFEAKQQSLEDLFMKYYGKAVSNE